MALIGISGKIGSGKDTVGKIIQWLIYVDKYQHDNTRNKDWHFHFDDNFNPITNREKESNWEIKRFAAKVKEICSILTGIPVADFEKQEVKDRVLGEEWNCWTYADVANDINLHKNRIEYPRLLSVKKIDNMISGYERKLTVRELLQQVGTDAMRNIIHPNVWVNALFSEYDVVRRWQKIDSETIKYPTMNWIITDTRFPNEAEAIKSRGGVLIRVNRESQADRFAKQDEDKAKYHHPSETSLDSYTGFNEYIDNNGTIEELIEKVKVILIKHKII